MDISIGTDIGVADLLAAIALVVAWLLVIKDRMTMELAIIFTLLAIAIIVVA